MNIILFGPPLAGKGTQSKNIISEFGLTHLSTGDVLRAEKEKQSELGIKAAEYSSKGLLAPDELVDQIVEKFYLEHQSDNGILFDGYPRNVEQANHLLKVIEQAGDKIDRAIFLKVSEDELLVRAEKRAIEENRKDDKDSEIVQTRIKEFVTSTIPAIQQIQQNGVKVVEIDGNQSIDAIYQIIRTSIG